MATEQNFQDVEARIDAATARVSAAIADLKQKNQDLQDMVKSLGLASAQEDAILTKLTAEADALDAIVPAPPPPPVDVPPADGPVAPPPPPPVVNN